MHAEPLRRGSSVFTPADAADVKPLQQRFAAVGECL